MNPLLLTPALATQVAHAKCSLSPRGKLAQLLHPILWAHWDPKPDEEILERVVKFQFGGAFLGTGSCAAMKGLVNKAQSIASLPLLISGDHESGCRSVEATPLGSAMNLGAVTSLDEAVRLAKAAGEVTARQGRAFGCRWSFGPVMDLNLNHDNPITNHRSFGSVERVCALGVAYALGMQEQGMAATMKHFPGDGVDARDQHVVTTVNRLSVEEWHQTYGQTFRAGIDAGIMSVMMGHIAWAARSSRHPKTGLLLPATVDPRIQIDLLREELGFEGLTITDAIGMGGLRTHFQSEQQCVVEALRGGADVALFVENPAAALDAMEKAINDGYLKESRVDDALDRVLAFKAKLGLLEDKLEEPASEESAYKDPLALDLSTQIAEKSLTLVRDWDQLYPLSLPTSAKIVLFELPMEPNGQPFMAVGEEKDKTGECSPLGAVNEF